MAFQYWTLVVEVIGSLGIMVTLVYLAIQLRQSTRQTLSENLEAAVTKYVGAATEMMKTEEDTDFLRRALNDYNGLSANQQARFYAWAVELMRGFEAISIKHRNALIDTNYFVEVQKLVIAWISCPGFTRMWHEVLKDLLPRRTREELEEALRAHKVPSAIELYPFLQLN